MLWQISPVKELMQHIAPVWRLRAEKQDIHFLNKNKKNILLHNFTLPQEPGDFTCEERGPKAWICVFTDMQIELQYMGPDIK